MVKKSLYISGAVVLFIVAFTVFSEKENIKYSSEGAIERDIDTNREITIVYDNVEKSSLKDETNETENLYVPEKYVETHAFDMQREYEISLMNLNQKEGILSSRYIKLYGTIDKSSFEMLIPEHLVQENHDIMLRVRNLKTGVEESTEATFLSDITSKSKTYTIEINPDAIYDFKFKKESLLLP